MNGWMYKFPYHWTKKDSIEWIIHWSDKNQLKYNDINEIINNVPAGQQLCKYNHKKFIKLCPNYGNDLYEDLQLTISSYLVDNLQFKYFYARMNYILR